MKRNTLVIIAVLLFLALAIYGAYESNGKNATSSIVNEPKIEQIASIEEVHLRN